MWSEYAPQSLEDKDIQQRILKKASACALDSDNLTFVILGITRKRLYNFWPILCSTGCRACLLSVMQTFKVVIPEA